MNNRNLVKLAYALASVWLLCWLLERVWVSGYIVGAMDEQARVISLATIAKAKNVD